MKEIAISINSSALAILKEKVSMAKRTKPALLFIGLSEPRQVNPEWGRAFNAGRDEKSLRELFMKLHANEVASSTYKIGVAVLEQDELPEHLLHAINGLTFALTPAQMESLNGGSIGYDGQEGLSLFDKHGKRVNI